MIKFRSCNTLLSQFQRKLDFILKSFINTLSHSGSAIENANAVTLCASDSVFVVHQRLASCASFERSALVEIGFLHI